MCVCVCVYIYMCVYIYICMYIYKRIRAESSGGHGRLALTSRATNGAK